MSHIRGALHIDRSPSEVFDFVSDERNEPSFNSGMESVKLTTPPPVGVGSVFNATMIARGRRVPMTVEFTEFERPSRLGSRSTASGVTFAGALSFSPDGEGTRLQWDWDVQPSGLRRFAGPLIALVGRRLERRIWTSLKRHLEAY
jgi:carbon monoxide dehydrogenase subunit G